MTLQKFHLLGDEVSTARPIEVDSRAQLNELKHLVAAHFAIVEPKGECRHSLKIVTCFKCEQEEPLAKVYIGIEFQSQDSKYLPDVSDITSSLDPVAITIDGHGIRDPPGPTGLPYVGNYFEVYPDHLGNHQRLFEQYGPLIKTTNMGRTTYQTNDPEISAIVFAESDFFTKKINDAHPLSALKTPAAGVFLGDTDTPEWKIAHKFLPPALGPKAVRHYAPTMQKTVEDAFKVFDAFDEKAESWNVYHYMLKLGSQAVGKLTLGLDFEHFNTIEAPLHEMVHSIAEILTLNKKVTSKGDWYGRLPFGDPQRLRRVKSRVEQMVEQSIEQAARGGVEDLPLQDAALKASNMVDYAIRATDNKGEKLPKSSLVWALVVATGAGFTTTSSLLSWLLYGLVTYPGMQERLLQELIDNGIDENTEITADVTDRLDFLDKYIKETQRRHNPSFQPGRTAKIDMILPGGLQTTKGRSGDSGTASYPQ
ncbi:hypothetical protein N7481_002183 [Penicillium waksmanii]|uniref:uncharacterized protein n=1 Tax=Penicillium waksmanii TaxID=69791 RepID=UPI0025483F0A|nr:uncharacterized protein N7481_002183 [Penicillium waksmanii]KAJ5995206.1 hypothetical protein N7481_002183 [Penicillium waksmanii]